MSGVEGYSEKEVVWSKLVLSLLIMFFMFELFNIKLGRQNQSVENYSNPAQLSYCKFPSVPGNFLLTCKFCWGLLEYLVFSLARVLFSATFLIKFSIFWDLAISGEDLFSSPLRLLVFLWGWSVRIQHSGLSHYLLMWHFFSKYSTISRISFSYFSFLTPSRL